MPFEKITFAGHAATFIQADSKVIAIDPWLKDNPACPEQLKNPKHIDFIVLTHGHNDHCGEAAQLCKSTGARLIATWELAFVMGRGGAPENSLVPMNKGGSISIDGFTFTLTQALHSSSFDTPNGTVYTGEPCGVVISDGTTAIYHAGDTALFSDMKLIGEMYRPKIALLPIGDRFTMGPREAAKAASFVGCKVAIPIHHSTFDMLTGTPAQFRDACKGMEIEVRELKPGESCAV